MKHIFIINPSAGKNDSRQRIYTMAEALREKMGDDSFEESKRRDLQTEAIYT